MKGYDHAHQAAEALTPGTEVTCYYDPANPAVAVLSRALGFGKRQWTFSAALCLAGIAAFGAGLYFELSR